MDELPTFSLREAAIRWPELGLPSLLTLEWLKGWNLGEILEKKISLFAEELGKKGVLLNGCIYCLLGCRETAVL